MSPEQVLERLRSARSKLEREGVLHLTLFGSQARGTAGEDSDVDIAIDVAPNTPFSILNLVGVEHIVAEATGKQANAFMLRSLDRGFKLEIERDGLPVF